MKKIFALITLSLVLNSCSFNLEQEGYNFDNFKGTPLSELALAVRDDNADEIAGILRENKLEIDLKDPEYNQTLLALAIQNNKRNAFAVLLKAGANPNQLLGDPQDATPFIYAIQNTDNCDLYYVENMLKYGANPNLEIKNPKPGYFFPDSFPLLVAIGKSDKEGEDCVNLVKLLVDNGADINCCYKQPYSDFCEGVISEALTLKSMETLKYFVIEKKITIPDTVIIIGGADKNTQEVYGLKEILKTDDYRFEDFVNEGEKMDRSKARKSKEEILKYLDQ